MDPPCFMVTAIATIAHNFAVTWAGKAFDGHSHCLGEVEGCLSGWCGE